MGANSVGLEASVTTAGLGPLNPQQLYVSNACAIRGSCQRKALTTKARGFGPEFQPCTAVVSYAGKPNRINSNTAMNAAMPMVSRMARGIERCMATSPIKCGEPDSHTGCQRIISAKRSRDRCGPA